MHPRERDDRDRSLIRISQLNGRALRRAKSTKAKNQADLAADRKIDSHVIKLLTSFGRGAQG